MTTKRVVWTDEAGAVRRLTPSPQAVAALMLAGATEDQAIEMIRAKHFRKHGYADGTNIVIVEAAELPYFGSFGRFAWRQNGPNAPVFDMGRARSIKVNQLRVERDVRLALEDIAYIRADETGNTAEKTRIATKKRQLRDLPVTIQPDIAAITTPSALETWQPTWPT